MKVYLVGTVWYSADQGDFPNSSDFPYFVFVDDLQSAKVKYDELSQSRDRSWGFGFERAYLVSMTPGVKGYETLYGKI